MKSLHKAVLSIVLLSSLVALGGDTGTNTIFEFPKSGSSWTPASVAEVGADIDLKEKTLIQVDQLTISGRLITHGFPLSIDVKRLIFKNGGSIVAFGKDGLDFPQPDRSPSPKTKNGSKGSTGASYCNNDDFKGSQRSGDDGQAGNPGVTGDNGIDGNSNPGAILIYAEEIDGTPMIDATGQKGGKGQQGGDGGNGGDGGCGADADSSLNIGFNAEYEPGGNGGHGHTGAAGGQGGNGGKGGLAVQVTLVVGGKISDTDYHQVISKPGMGGAPGAPGSHGYAGRAGRGGATDTDMFGAHMRGGSAPGNIVGSEAAPASSGTPGQNDLANNYEDAVATDISKQLKCDASTGNGCDLTPNRNIVSLYDLGVARKALFQDWYRYGWFRAFDYLVRISLSLVESSKADLALSNSVLNSPNPGTDAVAKFQATEHEVTRQLIIDDWTQYFLTPLSDASATTSIQDQLGFARSSAQAVIDALVLSRTDAQQALTNIKSILDGVSERTSQIFEKTSLNCSSYDGTENSLLQNTIGITGRYKVPACAPLDSSTTDQVDNVIVLENTVIENITPQDIHDRISKETPAETAWMEKFGISSAYADPVDVVYVKDEDNLLRYVVDSDPANTPTVAQEGVFHGFVLPKDENVTLDTFPIYLRVLSMKLGAM
jgi:hypothetical protein